MGCTSVQCNVRGGWQWVPGKPSLNSAAWASLPAPSPFFLKGTMFGGRAGKLASWWREAQLRTARQKARAPLPAPGCFPWPLCFSHCRFDNWSQTESLTDTLISLIRRGPQGPLSWPKPHSQAIVQIHICFAEDHSPSTSLSLPLLPQWSPGT